MTIIRALARRGDLVQQLLTNNIRNYATPGPMALGKKLKKGVIATSGREVEVPVEKDPKRLAAFVCGTNLFQESGEDVAIKPDSEYPDWLWTMHTGEPLPLSQLDPNTLEYWERVRELGVKQRKELNLLYRQKRDYK